MAAYDATLPGGCQRTSYLCDDGKDPKKRKWVDSLGPEVVYVSGRKRPAGGLCGWQLILKDKAAFAVCDLEWLWGWPSATVTCLAEHLLGPCMWNAGVPASERLSCAEKPGTLVQCSQVAGSTAAAMRLP